MRQPKPKYKPGDLLQTRDGDHIFITEIVEWSLSYYYRYYSLKTPEELNDVDTVVIEAMIKDSRGKHGKRRTRIL